ncbi:transcriptional regulator [Pseudomonas cavernicola]|uniref:Transcriptional regulator n=1 Tax=Pseudomonas cavernicola TaxID=2320866 RepID=A0A418XBH1_9PSED|nr:alginate export family protein [Pseudomonas cavernicola]RJG09708.1 transcriptional regulator [Pseudomonas cavernicola]
MTSNNRSVAMLVCTAGLLGSPAVLAAQPQPGLSYGANLKITAQSIDDLDLGIRDGGDFNGAGFSVRPWVYKQQGDWSAFALGEAFIATDVIESDTSESDTFDPNDARERDDHFLALREFWVDYGGLTAYPGESLRLGRQKIRSVDGLWWDSNIEALRWNFDTTLLNAHIGIAERFSDYRTDLDELAPQDEDRLHLLADISSQWRPGHWAGLKLHHSDDRGDLPEVGSEVDQLSKTFTGKLTWVGVELNGDFYNYRSTLPLSYWASATWLTGDTDTLRTRTVAGERRADGERSQDVDAWALDLGLRWNIDESWRIGTTYARTSGGADEDDSEQFVQTDLQSNRSNFTGTNSGINRFGEAYRGELNNLQAVSLFAGWRLNKDYDASLIYHRFWRVDDQQDSASGLQAALEPGDKDLGQEFDLVLTRYFNEGQMPAELGWLNASSALVRLRGGLFLPGDAFASGTDSHMHRAIIDFVWRY